MKTLRTSLLLLAVAVVLGACSSEERDQIGSIPSQTQVKAYQVEAQQLLRQIYNMQETYYAAHREYGSDFESIGVSIPRSAHYRFELTARGTTWSCRALANLDQDDTMDTWVVDQSGRITCATDDATS